MRDAGLIDLMRKDHLYVSTFLTLPNYLVLDIFTTCCCSRKYLSWHALCVAGSKSYSRGKCHEAANFISVNS